MDSRVSPDLGSAESQEPVQAVLAEVTCSWHDDADAVERATAVMLHAARDVLVLEASNPRLTFPPIGTLIQITGVTEHLTCRLAETGRGGRFLLAIGERPVRDDLRLRVSVPATLRSATLPGTVAVEVVDLTTAGARIQGVNLAAGSQVTFDFTPPGNDTPVSVSARVAHTSNRPDQAWIGVVFRLIAMRGGR